jgi:uncharacterized repeat protein (TIGR01451 family)
VVIAEIDTGESDRVEFANVSGSPLDLSGWRITVYDWVSWPDPQFTFTLPAGTTVPANGLFLLSDNGEAPGVYPNFFSGVNSYWDNNETNNAVAVLLQDALGGMVDFVCAFDPDISQIALPMPIPASQWSGPPIVANTNAANTFQRTGNSDSNNSNNWMIANGTIGGANPGMSGVFNGTHPLPVIPGTISNFSGGVWTGNLAVLQMGTGITLRASDYAGHSGSGNAFNVNGAADLALSMTASTNGVPAGQMVSFAIMVSNVGPSSAGSVFLTNVLASGFNFSNAASSQGTWARNGSLVTANVGTVPKGGTASLVVSGSFGVSGLFTNLAQVIGGPADPVGSNNLAAVTVYGGAQSCTQSQRHREPDRGCGQPAPINDASERPGCRGRAGLFFWANRTGGSEPQPGGPFQLDAELRAGTQHEPDQRAGGRQWVTQLECDSDVPGNGAAGGGGCAVHRSDRARAGAIRDPVQRRAGIWLPGAICGNVERGCMATLSNLALAPVFVETAASDTIAGPQRFYRARNLTVTNQPPWISRAEKDGAIFTVYFEGEPGRSYAVESRDGLGSGTWSTLTTISLPPMWMDEVVVDPANTGGRFYRVVRSDGRR